MILLHIFCAAVLCLVTVLITLIVVRSLYQAFSDTDEGMLYSFLYSTTEPVLCPVRSVLLRSKFFSSVPIDFSGVITVLALVLIRELLVLV